MINYKSTLSVLTLIIFLGFQSLCLALDSDGDSITDDIDNCIAVSNVEQIDSNNDGFGNRCDGDFDGTCVVDLNDYFTFLSVFGTSITQDPQYDINSDGDIDSTDYYMFLQLFGTSVTSGTTTCTPPPVP